MERDAKNKQLICVFWLSKGEQRGLGLERKLLAVIDL